MKPKLFLSITFSFLLFIPLSFGQSPQSFTYQAVVRDNSGDVLKSQNVAFKISVLKGNILGESEFVEVHSTTTNEFGLANLEVGKGDLISGDFSAIPWGDDKYFLKIELDPTGGTSFQPMGTSQLLSVPYALYAENAKNVEDDDADPVNEIQTISRTGLTVTLSNGGGTFSDSVLTETIVDGFVSDNGYATKDMRNQNITNLADPVNSQDAATKAYVDTLIEQLYTQGVLRVGDYDGNYYNIIKIGNQFWMAENLKVTHYRNGDAIPLVTDNTAWSNLITGARCYYNNDSVTYAGTYGPLYNWYTVVDSRNLCPTGWHMPSDAEWTTLDTYLGGFSVAGGKMKETGTTHWNSPNTGATNESGFTGLPGGARIDNSGLFDYIRYLGHWWSSTENNETYVWLRGLSSNDTNFYKLGGKKKQGFSVRCLRD